MSKDLTVYFVLPEGYDNELETSTEMQQAFQSVMQNNMFPEWIREKDVPAINYKEKDIIVFEKFQGNSFDGIKTSPGLSVVGPWCLITCLLDGLSIPNNKSPVYNMAMSGLIVTASGFSVEQKRKIKERIEYMGAVFSINITSNVTHLVTNSVITQKYIIAKERGMPVMLDSWVEDVWNESLQRNVKATDPEFAKHNCPIFHKLVITSTGFEPKLRSQVQKLIESNGGTYTGKMATVRGSTNFLVCSPGVHSEKFTVALKAKISCVRLEWVTDSVEKGYLLPETDYIIKMSSSTPTKNDAPLNADFSMLSVIAGGETTDNFKNTISDTVNMSILNLTTASTKESTTKPNKKTDLVDKIDLKQVKQAGAFLDGCGVYLAGFNPETREKLCRVLKSAGATRYDDISDRVTQILVGDPDAHEIRLFDLKNCGLPMVSTEWLLECINQRQPVNEEPYILRNKPVTAQLTPSSPLSKKCITLLRHDSSIMENEARNAEEPMPDANESIMMYLHKNKNNEEEDTLAQLMAQGDLDSKLGNASDKCNKSGTKKSGQNFVTRACETTDYDEETWNPIFQDKTFKLIGFTEEENATLSEMIVESNGKIVSPTFKGITDYAVVPIISNKVRHTATEIVNGLWIYDCYSENQLLDIEYYHQPFYSTSYDKPLKGCVIAVSGYAKFERQYLGCLIEHLGALFQDKFAKVTLADKSVFGSTHLISIEASGSKYNASKAWGIPALSHKWLLECAEKSIRVDEGPYLWREKDISASNESKKNMDTSKNSTKREQQDRSVRNELKKITETPKIDAKKNSETPKVAAKREHQGKAISPIQKKEESGNNEVNEPGPSEKKFKGSKPETSASSSKETPSLMGVSKTKNDDIPAEPSDFDMDNLPCILNKENMMVDGDGGGGVGVGEPMITTEDGRRVWLSVWKAELQQLGVFSAPSPLPAPAPATPFADMLRRLRHQGRIRDYTVSEKCETPVKILKNEFDREPGGSQDTPVGKYLKDLQQRNVLPSSPKHMNTPDSPMPRPFYEIDTPKTPLGQFMEDDPSPETRKHWQRYINRFPHYKCHDRAAPPARRLSTPLSEVKRQAWDILLGDKDKNDSDKKETIARRLSAEYNDDDNSEMVEVKEAEAAQGTETQDIARNHLNQLQDMLKSRESSGTSKKSLFRLDLSTPKKLELTNTSTSETRNSDTKDSQADTVGWDDPLVEICPEEMCNPSSQPPAPPAHLRKFMLTGLDSEMKEACESTLRSLGAEVSLIAHFDESATHLLCANPTRNEKVLSSMASGKWIVHVSYIQNCQTAGKFLDEEAYEFGNPKSADTLNKIVKTQQNMDAMHWWRLKVAENGHGAFHDMRALLFVGNKAAIIRLIEAGGGVIVNASPPFTHNIDVTHCFIDSKCKMDMAEFIPLVQQGVHCLNIVYLSAYLNNKASTDMLQHVPSQIRQYL